MSDPQGLKVEEAGDHLQRGKEEAIKLDSVKTALTEPQIDLHRNGCVTEDIHGSGSTNRGGPRTRRYPACSVVKVPQLLKERCWAARSSGGSPGIWAGTPQTLPAAPFDSTPGRDWGEGRVPQEVEQDGPLPFLAWSRLLLERSEYVSVERSRSHPDAVYARQGRELNVTYPRRPRLRSSHSGPLGE